MPGKLIQTALLAMVACSSVARAAEPDSLLLSGFGTVGLVHSSQGQADFTSGLFKATGAGFSNRWSTNVDTLIAGHVTTNFTSHLSAILQVVSEQSHDSSWRPHEESANVKYQVTPEFSVRAGRTVLPAFVESDTRNLGFSNPWVRPPLEVCYLVPITSIDGVDTSYSADG